MAKIGSAELDFEAKDVNVKKAFDNVGNGFDDLGKKADKYNKKTKKVKKGNKDMNASLFSLAKKIGAVTLAWKGINLAYDKVIKETMEFEKRMTNINTLLGLSKDELKGFSKQVLDVSTRVPVDQSLLSESLYDIVSAGISDTSEALKVLEDSGKLAVAGLGSVGEAADLVTSSINAFGVESDRAANAIFKAVKSGKTNVAELAQGFGATAGIAKEMGVEFEEFLAITAAGTTTGKKAAKVWTEQKAVLTALVKPTKEMSDLFTKLGVESGKELIDTAGGLVPALEKLKEATEGNDNEFAKALSSAEGLGLALQILGESGDAYTSTLEDMQSGTDALTEGFEEQMTTLDKVWKILKNKLEASLKKIGLEVIPKITAALKWLGENLDKIGSVASNIANILLNVLGLAFNTLVQQIKGALGIIAGVWETFAGLFTGDWDRMWNGLLGIFKGFWDATIGILTSALSKIQNIVQSGLQIITDLGFKPFGIDLALMWKKLWNGLLITLNEHVGKFLQALGQFIPGLKDWGDGMVAEAERLKDELEELEDEQELIMHKGRVAAENELTQLADNVADIREKMKEDNSQSLKDQLIEAEELLEQTKERYGEKYGEIRVKTSEELTKMRAEGLMKLREFLSGMEQELKNVPLAEAGALMIQNLINGMASKNAALKKQVSAIKASLSAIASASPVKVKAPGAGFKEGGPTGVGKDSDIAGVVHRNEYVIPSKLVNKLKPTGFLGMLEGMRRNLKGFAEGGMTSGAAPVNNTFNLNVPTTIRADQSIQGFGNELLFNLKKYA
jgi:TP901 family phage tail tape measure protein